VIVSLAAGVLLLTIGAEALVRGASRLAGRLGVDPLLVGLTIVAFGTSAPEMVVSVTAARAGNGDVAIGNVVGSNVANILLILGTSALIRPPRVRARAIRGDVPIMIVVSLAMVPVLLDGRVGRVAGLALVAGILIYTALGVSLARREHDPEVETEFAELMRGWPRGALGETALVAAGLALLVWGSALFVGGAVGLARALHVSDALIGLTIVAVGTSLPELATSTVAAARGEGDIAIGNVVGSNIFNLLAILGVSAAVRPLQASGLARVDLLVMAAAAVLLLPLARSGMRISRAEGALMLAGYAAWIGWRALQS